MRTLNPRPAAPAALRPAPARDSALPLAPSGRFRRAKEDSPAPALAAAAGGHFEAHEQAVIDAALAILRARLRRPGACITSPSAARTVALLHLANREQECFAVMFLGTQHDVIAFEEMFQGTLAQTSVYPREVVRAALRHNAAAVILAHNHPSGLAVPSEADKVITALIRDALALVDVKTLDHLIVAGDRVASFAELGLLKIA